MVPHNSTEWDVVDIAVVTQFPRQVREIENVWIPMPDGVRLAARIWLPNDAEADPVPAILEYLPYRKRDGTVERDHLTHPYFAGHGYAGVRVDMRGTGDSEGVCLGEYLAQEQDDAVAVIAWLAAQPWCAGKVGMIGISWGGFNGLQLAARQPPALKAVISLCSTDDRYADDIHFMGGCLLGEKLSWGATAFAIANTPPDPAIVGERWRQMWAERLEANGLWLLDWFRHQRRDAFYAHGSICEDYSAINIPVYAVGGWADGYTNPIFRMMEHLPGPKKALIGPWAHKYPHFAMPGPRIGFLQECLRWWDQHLKDIDTGIMAEPMIRAWIQEPAAPSATHTERPGRWVAETSFTAPGGQFISLYPGPKGLTADPQAQEILVKSPQNAGWTNSVWCGYGAVPDGPLDQNGELGLMAMFETDPFDDDLDLLGFPVFRAQAASDREQANIAVTLSAVHEDGTATLLTFGVFNLCHHASHAEPQPLVPGKPVPIQVQLNVLGQRITKGQRLRLGLSTSYWPMIWPSPQPAKLTLTDARLDLPVRTAKSIDETLAPFGPAEGAAPVETEILSEPHYSRTRAIDYATGAETLTVINSSGRARYQHTGTITHNHMTETFSIDPDDPNSATGHCRMTMAFERADWSAKIDADVKVEALRDVWRITAQLEATSGDDVVAKRDWQEDIPRDLV